MRSLISVFDVVIVLQARNQRSEGKDKKQRKKMNSVRE
jgi:hypothetical protein